MNELKIFENSEFGEVRTAVVNNEPMFCLVDVCRVLEMSNPTVVAQRLEEDEVAKLDLGLNNGVKSNFVTESGLYAVILRSDKPNAKKFRKWVTGEVLPSIRKHGGYIAGQETMSDDDLLARALMVAQNKIAERDKLILEKEVRIQEMKPKEIFADAVVTSKTSILIGELAKILNQNGYDTGEKRLFAWLRNNGYLIKRKGTDYNAPTQRSMGLGLFEVKETAVTHADGHVTVNKTTKVTGKGQQYFINKFLVEVAG